MEQNIQTEIFRLNFWKLLTEYTKTEIPIIQRDYAQGRIDDKAKDVRSGILSSLFISLTTNQPIDFDFVYGYIKDEKFFPLDGQQRLSTLFLLHWYLANKEGFRIEAENTLRKFTYETRSSTRDFCTSLVSNDVEANGYNSFSDAIEDSSWYYSDWQYDPSIKSMLIMLNAIHEKFNSTEIQLFEKLRDENIVSFIFLEIENFGLSDDLYIKMNARGKPLTDFENFKAKFGQLIENRYPEMLDEFSLKVDGIWVDLFWPYRYQSKKCPVIDFAFMRFFYFITEMMFFKSGLKDGGDDEKTSFLYNSDNNPLVDFKLIEATYAIKENIDFLFSVLNRLSESEDLNILFASLFYQNRDEDYKGKVRLFDNNKHLNLFARCVSDTSNEFGLMHKILLFAQLKFMVTFDKTDGLADFLRVIRNLLKSRSLEYKILSVQLNNIDTLMTKDIHQLLIGEKLNIIGFSPEQIAEEIFKAKLIKYNISNKDVLYYAEDITLLDCSIKPLIIASYSTVDNLNVSRKLSEFDVEKFPHDFFSDITFSYRCFSINKFHEVWGDLIIFQDVFRMEAWRSRMTYNKNYHISEEVIRFVKKKASPENFSMDSNAFAISQEKEFVRCLLSEINDLSQVKEIRKQLYMYYIFTKRIIEKDFFENDRWNVGWLKRAIGFKSLFKAGTLEDDLFNDTNPVYQLYRESFAVNTNYILGVDQVGNNAHRSTIFQELEDWSNVE